MLKRIIKPKHDEELEQIALVQWFDYSYPQYTIILPTGERLSLFWHTPNGGKRTITEAVRLKRQGVRAGVPDLFLAVPCGTFHGLFIELKTLVGKLSDKQKKYLELLNSQGYKAVVCYGWDAAAKEIKEYLHGKSA